MYFPAEKFIKPAILGFDVSYPAIALILNPKLSVYNNKKVVSCVLCDGTHTIKTYLSYQVYIKLSKMFPTLRTDLSEEGEISDTVVPFSILIQKNVENELVIVKNEIYMFYIENYSFYGDSDLLNSKNLYNDINEDLEVKNKVHSSKFKEITTSTAFSTFIKSYIENRNKKINNVEKPQDESSGLESKIYKDFDVLNIKDKEMQIYHNETVKDNDIKQSIVNEQAICINGVEETDNSNGKENDSRCYIIDRQSISNIEVEKTHQLDLKVNDTNLSIVEKYPISKIGVDITGNFDVKENDSKPSIVDEQALSKSGVDITGNFDVKVNISKPSIVDEHALSKSGVDINGNFDIKENDSKCFIEDKQAMSESGVEETAKLGIKENDSKCFIVDKQGMSEGGVDINGNFDIKENDSKCLIEDKQAMSESGVEKTAKLGMKENNSKCFIVDKLGMSESKVDKTDMKAYHTKVSIVNKQASSNSGVEKIDIKVNHTKVSILNEQVINNNSVDITGGFDVEDNKLNEKFEESNDNAFHTEFKRVKGVICHEKRPDIGQNENIILSNDLRENPVNTETNSGVNGDEKNVFTMVEEKKEDDFLSSEVNRLLTNNIHMENEAINNQFLNLTTTVNLKNNQKDNKDNHKNQEKKESKTEKYHKNNFTEDLHNIQGEIKDNGSLENQIKVLHVNIDEKKTIKDTDTTNEQLNVHTLMDSDNIAKGKYHYNPFVKFSQSFNGDQTNHIKAKYNIVQGPLLRFRPIYCLSEVINTIEKIKFYVGRYVRTYRAYIKINPKKKAKRFFKEDYYGKELIIPTDFAHFKTKRRYKNKYCIPMNKYYVYSNFFHKYNTENNFKHSTFYAKNIEKTKNKLFINKTCKKYLKSLKEFENIKRRRTKFLIKNKTPVLHISQYKARVLKKSMDDFFLNAFPQKNESVPAMHEKVLKEEDLQIDMPVFLSSKIEGKTHNGFENGKTGSHISNDGESIQISKDLQMKNTIISNNSQQVDSLFEDKHSDYSKQQIKDKHNENTKDIQKDNKVDIVFSRVEACRNNKNDTDVKIKEFMDFTGKIKRSRSAIYFETIEICTNKLKTGLLRNNSNVHDQSNIFADHCLDDKFLKSNIQVQVNSNMLFEDCSDTQISKHINDSLNHNKIGNKDQKLVRSKSLSFIHETIKLYNQYKINHVSNIVFNEPYQSITDLDKETNKNTNIFSKTELHSKFNDADLNDKNNHESSEAIDEENKFDNNLFNQTLTDTECHIDLTDQSFFSYLTHGEFDNEKTVELNNIIETNHIENNEVNISDQIITKAHDNISSIKRVENHLNTDQKVNFKDLENLSQEKTNFNDFNSLLQTEAISAPITIQKDENFLKRDDEKGLSPSNVSNLKNEEKLLQFIRDSSSDFKTKKEFNEKVSTKKLKSLKKKNLILQEAFNKLKSSILSNDSSFMTKDDDLKNIFSKDCSFSINDVSIKDALMSKMKKVDQYAQITSSVCSDAPVPIQTNPNVVQADKFETPVSSIQIRKKDSIQINDAKINTKESNNIVSTIKPIEEDLIDKNIFKIPIETASSTISPIQDKNDNSMQKEIVKIYIEKSDILVSSIKPLEDYTADTNIFGTCTESLNRKASLIQAEEDSNQKGFLNSNKDRKYKIKSPIQIKNVNTFQKDLVDPSAGGIVKNTPFIQSKKADSTRAENIMICTEKVNNTFSTFHGEATVPISKYSHKIESENSQNTVAIYKSNAIISARKVYNKSFSDLSFQNEQQEKIQTERFQTLLNHSIDKFDGYFFKQENNKNITNRNTVQLSLGKPPYFISMESLDRTKFYLTESQMHQNHQIQDSAMKKLKTSINSDLNQISTKFSHHGFVHKHLVQKELMPKPSQIDNYNHIMSSQINFKVESMDEGTPINYSMDHIGSYQKSNKAEYQDFNLFAYQQELKKCVINKLEIDNNRSRKNMNEDNDSLLNKGYSGVKGNYKSCNFESLIQDEISIITNAKSPIRNNSNQLLDASNENLIQNKAKDRGLGVRILNIYKNLYNKYIKAPGSCNEESKKSENEISTKEKQNDGENNLNELKKVVDGPNIDVCSVDNAVHIPTDHLSGIETQVDMPECTVEDSKIQIEKDCEQKSDEGNIKKQPKEDYSFDNCIKEEKKFYMDNTSVDGAFFKNEEDEILTKVKQENPFCPNSQEIKEKSQLEQEKSHRNNAHLNLLDPDSNIDKDDFSFPQLKINKKSITNENSDIGDIFKKAENFDLTHIDKEDSKIEIIKDKTIIMKNKNKDVINETLEFNTDDFTHTDTQNNQLKTEQEGIDSFSSLSKLFQSEISADEVPKPEQSNENQNSNKNENDLPEKITVVKSDFERSISLEKKSNYLNNEHERIKILTNTQVNDLISATDKNVSNIIVSNEHENDLLRVKDENVSNIIVQKISQENELIDLNELSVDNLLLLNKQENELSDIINESVSITPLLKAEENNITDIEQKLEENMGDESFSLKIELKEFRNVHLQDISFRCKYTIKEYDHKELVNETNRLVNSIREEISGIDKKEEDLYFIFAKFISNVGNETEEGNIESVKEPELEYFYKSSCETIIKQRCRINSPIKQTNIQVNDKKHVSSVDNISHESNQKYPQINKSTRKSTARFHSQLKKNIKKLKAEKAEEAKYEEYKKRVLASKMKKNSEDVDKELKKRKTIVPANEDSSPKSTETDRFEEPADIEAVEFIKTDIANKVEPSEKVKSQETDFYFSSNLITESQENEKSAEEENWKKYTSTKDRADIYLKTNTDYLLKKKYSLDKDIKEKQENNTEIKEVDVVYKSEKDGVSGAASSPLNTILTPRRKFRNLMDLLPRQSVNRFQEKKQDNVNIEPSSPTVTQESEAIIKRRKYLS